MEKKKIPTEEARKAVAALDSKERASLAKKLSDVEVPEKFPEGTGEVPLAEEEAWEDAEFRAKKKMAKNK